MEDQSFVPLFPFGEPNQSVVLAKDDEVLIKDNNGTTLSIVNAEIRLDLLPQPRINVHIINVEELNDLERLELSFMITSDDLFYLEFKKYKIQIKGYAVTFHSSYPKKLSLIFSPSSNSIVGVGNENTKIKYVVFHLFNFKNIFANNGTYSKHVHLEADKWVVELKSLADSKNIFKKLINDGGYGLTHVGCLRKKDDTLISVKEVEEMLDVLRCFFSFAKGDWSDPVCPVGFDSSGRVWELWSSPRYSSQYNLFPESWFDEQHSEQIENLFPGFMNKWNNKDWNKAFKEVLYWYLNSNKSPQDIGIILAQTALERLSFEYAVKKRKLINESSFLKLKAPDKFRLILSSLEIPIEIMEYSSELLVKLAKETKWEDAPRAISEIRNSIVHPNNKREQFESSIYETWNLSLLYLELILLCSCEYSGKYYNRVNARVELVPWKK